LYTVCKNTGEFIVVLFPRDPTEFTPQLYKYAFNAGGVGSGVPLGTGTVEEGLGLGDGVGLGVGLGVGE